MGSMMTGMALWMVLWIAVGVAVLVVAVLAGVWLVRAPRTHETPGSTAEIDILRRRYAAGEIDEEDYQRRLRLLTGGWL